MESVEKGHFEEEAGDMLTVNPGTRIYYFGRLKRLLITNPAFDPKYERHIRNVEDQEYEAFKLSRGLDMKR